MARYAVIGASQGTGLAITQRLAKEGHSVRAISRTPPAAAANIEPFAADVTDARSIGRALDDAFDAVFFTVDATGGIGGHALFGSREKIRAVTYQGCLNAIAGAREGTRPKAFVLLSVIGCDTSSMIWSMLNTLKPGSKRNVFEREEALKSSGLPYVITRAAKLNDEPAGAKPLTATSPTHRLVSSMGTARADLARAMIQAAGRAPKNTTWDVFNDAEVKAPTWLSAEGAR